MNNISINVLKTVWYLSHLFTDLTYYAFYKNRKIRISILFLNILQNYKID